MEEEILRALNVFVGSEKRWAERRAKGLTDRELLDAIREEFYLGGGFRHPGLSPCCYKGGPAPAFYFGSLTPKGAKTSLKGKLLVDKVRQLLRIPWPAQGLQGKLF